MLGILNHDEGLGCAATRFTGAIPMKTSPRRALIVIDVQNEYVTGNLLIEHPPVNESLHNIGLAIDAARASGIPVIVVQNASAEGPLFARGSTGWQLHEVVATRKHDHRVEKSLPSAFPETDLQSYLQEQGVDTLTVIGYMTQNCDASTIVHALHMGLTVEFLHDASGTVSYRNEAGYVSAEDMHRVYCVVMHSRFAAVVSTAQWLHAVQQSQALARSNIHASHQAAMQR